NPELPTQVRWRSRLKLTRRKDPGLDRWVLLANPERLRLADVYRKFVFDISPDRALTNTVEEAVEQGLARSLTNYFEPPAEG
ncbi:MAG: hypothetical protein ABI351_11060, partial [Herbaspirillum sp.]